MGSERQAWPETPADERELVRRLRAGDEAAFEAFADAYFPALYRFARRRLDDDRDLTRDIVQSTLCKVIENLHGFRGEAPLATWLCACCRNEIAAHFRRLGRRPREVALDDALPPAAPADLDERLDRRERAERVHAALDRMPPAYARALEWRYFEGHAVPEIARRLALGYKAAESLLSRARAAFHASYGRLAEHPSEEAVAP
jgi:RNA polymerase sigma-70 factor (ECF subfamily)